MDCKMQKGGKDNHISYMKESNSLPIKIRIASPPDIPLLTDIGAETFSDTFAEENTPQDMKLYLAGAFSPEQQALEMADPATKFLIAQTGGEVVGYARIIFRNAPVAILGRAPMEISRLYSRKPWIGKGVGAAVMRACLREATTHRCDVVWLDVWEQNPRAIAFYSRWGFLKAGTQTFKLGNDLQHDLIMARPTVLTME
jgi:diamine N-acetyltransferase